MELRLLEEYVDISTERVNESDLLLAAADMCIPTFTVKKKINPPWITKDILNKIKKKKRLWRKIKARPSEAPSRTFKELRRSVKQLIRSGRFLGVADHQMTSSLPFHTLIFITNITTG